MALAVGDVCHALEQGVVYWDPRHRMMEQGEGSCQLNLLMRTGALLSYAHEGRP